MESLHDDKIPVRINISIPQVKCEFVGLDIQDEMGRHDVGAVEQTEKTPINANAGCNFHGAFHINKVPGNFHVSTHASGRHDFVPNFQHILHELRFGDQLDAVTLARLPSGGSFNPVFQLDQTKAMELSSHEYVIKVVPTIYETAGAARRTFLYQYTYAYKSYIAVTHGHGVVPAIWFKYDLTPITVKYKERRAPFYTFVTTVCAIVGGTFTVAGIIDGLILSSLEIFRKVELGKQG